MRDSVLVCIPTFKRPKMLRRLLDALAALDTDADVRVLVADNDAKVHAGFDLCHAMTGYRWPLSAVIAARARHRPGPQHSDRTGAKDRCALHRHDR